MARGDVDVVEREEADRRVLAVDLVEAGLLQLVGDADGRPGAARIEVQRMGARPLGGRHPIEEDSVPVASGDRLGVRARGDVGDVEVLVEQESGLRGRCCPR